MLFDPSQEEIAKGEKLFHPDHKHKIEFLKSALYTEHLPQHDIPEVKLSCQPKQIRRVFDDNLGIIPHISAYKHMLWVLSRNASGRKF